MYFLADTAESKSRPLSRRKRILNGVFATNQEFPWLVAIEYKKDKTDQENSFCAGSILNEWYILTAAHCVYLTSAESIEIRAGSSLRLEGGTTYGVSNVKIHPEYNASYSVANDIAILKLETPVDLENNIWTKQSIPLYYSKDPIRRDTVAQVAGWGVTTLEAEGTCGKVQKQLQKLRVKIIDYKYCNELWSHDGGLPAGTICAATSPRDATSSTCNGDSGGSLVIDEKLVGITSHNNDGKDPDIYTKVAYFKTWIEEKKRKKNS